MTQSDSVLARVALAAALALPLCAQADAELAQKKFCFACHASDKALVGPAFRDVAARYAGDSDAPQRLASKVQRGGSGVWSAMAMPANDVTPDEAGRLVRWVLSGASAAPQPNMSAAIAASRAAERQVVSEATLRQGRYLVEHVMGCGNCHAGRAPDTKPIAGMELAGGRIYDLPAWFAQPVNLTSDLATGIGAWPTDAIVRAITAGVRPNGTPLAPMMPANFYKALTPDDANAVVAYLANVPPIHNPTKPPQYRQPWTVDRYPDAEITFDPGQMARDKVFRGRYLAALAHCLDCHTPAVGGVTDYVRDGGKGGRRFGAARVLAPNISSHPVTGVGAWTDAELQRAIFDGQGRDGRTLQYPMPWPYLAGLTAYDKASLVAWLRTVPAQP